MKNSNIIYNLLFKGTCSKCGMDSIPFHNDIDHDDGTFVCDCGGMVEIPDIQARNEAWAALIKNKKFMAN